jgi:hypothetical protein
LLFMVFPCVFPQLGSSVSAKLCGVANS